MSYIHVILTCFSYHGILRVETLPPSPGLEAVDQGQLFGNILADASQIAPFLFAKDLTSMGDLQDPKMEVLYICIHLYHFSGHMLGLYPLT